MAQLVELRRRPGAALLLIAWCIGSGCASAPTYAQSQIDGMYVIAEEVSGYQNERLELKKGRFRYWFRGDSVLVDERGREVNRTKYPIRGTFRVQGPRIIFGNEDVEDRYADVVNGVPVLWRLDSKRIWERRRDIYDYGVLIRVAGSDPDIESPSIRVLYDAEMRKRRKEWRDPFVHGPQ